MYDFSRWMEGTHNFTMVKATILIVDDEPTNLSLMMALLRPYYHVRQHGDALQVEVP